MRGRGAAAVKDTGPHSSRASSDAPPSSATPLCRGRFDGGADAEPSMMRRDDIAGGREVSRGWVLARARARKDGALRVQVRAPRSAARVTQAELEGRGPELAFSPASGRSVCTRHGRSWRQRALRCSPRSSLSRSPCCWPRRRWRRWVDVPP